MNLSIYLFGCIGDLLFVKLDDGMLYIFDIWVI